MLRLALVLPTLRLFMVVSATRRVVFFIAPLLPYMTSVIMLMATFLGAWSILGVSLFEGLVEEALQDNVR